MTRLAFSVTGTPIPQPRERVRIVMPRRGKPFAQHYVPSDHPVWRWKSAVAGKAAIAHAGEPWEGPVTLRLMFYFSRPQRLLRKSSPRGPISHTVTCDSDNLAKAVMDAMTDAGVWRDDRQVDRLSVRKCYVAMGYAPGVRVLAIHRVPMVAPALIVPVYPAEGASE